MPKPVFGYWNCRGFGNPIRFMLAYLGVEVDEKRIPVTQIGVDYWKRNKSNLGLDFPNLPYWKENGSNLTETSAILRYIAREKSKDLMPTEPELVKKAEMLENLLLDVWTSLIKTCVTYTDETKELFKSGMAEKFPQLEEWMGSNEFLLGDQLSYVDFFLYEILVHYQVYDSKSLEPYSHLQEFKGRFESLPRIANYIKSEEYVASPCFHPMFMSHKI